MDQVDEPTVESVVAVAGEAINPEGAADNVERVAQILRFPTVPKPTREEVGFSGGMVRVSKDSLERIGWSYKSSHKGLFRATLQPPSAPTAQQSLQQPHLAEEYSTFCRREDATKDE